MAHLLESDADIYRKLCWYVNNRMDFPGADQMARDVGYKNGQSVRESLRRLDAAGYIEIRGDKQISAIVIKPSGIRLSARKKINVVKRRFP